MRISRLVYILLVVCQLHAGFFPLNFLGKQTAQFFVDEFEETKQQLNSLKNELARAQQTEIAIDHQMQRTFIDLQKQSETVDAESAVGPLRDVAKKKRDLINDHKQQLGETSRLYKQMIGTLKKSIEVLSLYIDNPLFVDVRLAEKSWYTFDELQTVAKQFYGAVDELNQSKDQRKRVEQELQPLDQLISSFEQELRQKEQEIKSNGSHKTLLVLEIDGIRKKIEQVKVKKIALAKEIDLLNIQLSLATKKTELLRKDLTRIERKLLVTDLDVQHEQAQFNKLKNEHDIQREAQTKALALLVHERDEVHKQFERINIGLKNPIKDLKQLSELPGVMSDDTEFYQAFFAYAREQEIESSIGCLEAQQALDDAQLARVDAQLEMIKAWFAISQRRLLHNIEDQNKRLASFNAQKNELERQIEEYKNKNIALVQQASMLNHVVTHIQQYLAAKNGDKKYHDLRRAVEALRKQQSNFDQLAKIYSAIIPVKVELNNYLDLVIQKLNSTSSVFQRSAGAITLEGIKSVLVDIKFFADFAFSIVSTASVLQVVAWCKDLLGDFVALLNLLFVLVLALAVYFAGLIALPLAQQRVIAFEQQHAATLLSNFMRALLQFVYTKLVGIVCWLVLFYLIRYDWAVTIGPSAKVIFYVSSIFYLSFLLGAFKRLYLTNNSLMLQKDFMRRFVMVAQLFLAVTVITYFLSEALITIVYGHSALSRTLWAIYSLVARALIIFLIMDKHVILGLIPERGAVWAMVRQQVDRYYYLFLLFAIALIVLSDPFIGYGLLVTTVLKAALLTIGLLVVLYWVHEFLKQNSSQLFFASSGEQVRERFAHSKTWYALFIIVSFSALIIGAILLFARIWGHAISLQTIANFFDIEIVPVQGDIAGTKISITLRSLLTVVGFIFAGFLLSSLFNRYVLQRIYLLLHVNAGVQNTITRVSGYLFIIIPLIFGLQRAGLGSWIPSLGVLLMLGIAWAVKGPADDFFAYFIILVERSIKIGDYIRVESLRGDISGVVRKITPRSVVLRRRNSYAVIVPNSKLLRTYVYNWNYSHNYFGFDDIFVTVGFDADQDKVREILLDILDNNPHVLKNPPPIIRIDNFTINGYEILIRAFLPTTEVLNQWDIRSDVRFAILREFKKHNIKLAAPIQGIKLDINKSTDDQ